MNRSNVALFLRTDGPREAFVERLHTELVPAAAAVDASRVALCATTRPGDRIGVVPLRRANLAMLSLDAADDASIDAMKNAMRRIGEDVFGYRVRTSYPLRYARDWPLGERSPGDVLLTLLVPRAGLAYDAFLHEWHGVHTPKAMRIHPMWSYRRDVVIEPLAPNAPSFAGIVGEHYRSLDDLRNPVRMFGGPLRFLPQMLEVARHVRSFLDLRRTENYLLHEWVLRDDAPLT